MEDYDSAFLARQKDTDILRLQARYIAAMHFGGVTLECLLKSIILNNLPKGASREWKTDTNCPNHTITNPGHDFQNALRRCNRLNARVQKFPQVIKWINLVEFPQGHFIDMRYSSNEPSDAEYKEWLSAYNSLRGWLQKQATQP
jgi:hypothetical protein